MAQNLKGKSAVVTGGGDGIGRATALALAAEGAKVVINDIARDPEGKSKADNVVNEITKANGTAVANYDSVATMAGGKNIIKTATSNFGRVDILVNSAGNFKLMPTTELTEKDWDSIMDVHTKGHFSCIKAAIPEMIKQKSGRIINISSRAATFGAANLAYATAKAGIMGLTLMLSAELEEHGITVNVIFPSAETKLFPGPGPQLGDKIPGYLDRGADCVAIIIAYLTTDQAKNVTGQLIYSSGGDICIYARPLQLPGPHMFIRKIGKWTIDELSNVIPPLAQPGTGKIIPSTVKK